MINGCDSRAVNLNEDQIRRLRARLPNSGGGEDEKKYIYNIDRNYPLFGAVFTCPLWGLYINPNNGKDKKYINDIYREAIKDIELDFNVFSVCYTDAKYKFKNLYHVLNSLAIQ